jgi:hypothetical protein
MVILATPSALALEIVAPLEVFAPATQKLREIGRECLPAYEVELVSATADLTIRSVSGIPFRPIEPPVTFTTRSTRCWLPEGWTFGPGASKKNSSLGFCSKVQLLGDMH